MNQTDLSLMLPIIVLAAGVLAVLLLSAFVRSHRSVASAAAAVLVLALASVTALWPSAPRPATQFLFVDRLSLLFSYLVLFATLCVALLAYPYLRRHRTAPAEFYLLLLLAALGGVVLAMSAHFASLFLGIELLGVPLVALAAYLPRRPQGDEAGLKYLVLAGVASATLLFGMALLYAEVGSLSFSAVLSGLSAAGGSALLRAGSFLMIAGIGFKLAAVPFHMWTPDVYDGAPAPVTAFVATASKAAVIPVLLRLFPPSLIAADRTLFAAVAGLSVASMIVGNLLALRQRNVKRMLAYSSIAHYGYLLVLFLAAGPHAPGAVVLYAVVYVITNLAAFGSVSLLSDAAGDADDLASYTGLLWRRPVIALSLMAALLSLLGMPVTAGFIAKFLVVAAGVSSSLLAVVLVLILTTAAGAFYYLRVIMALFLRPEEIPVASVHFTVERASLAGAAVVLLQALALLWIGVYPQPLIDLIRASVLQ